MAYTCTAVLFGCVVRINCFICSSWQGLLFERLFCAHCSPEPHLSQVPGTILFPDLGSLSSSLPVPSEAWGCVVAQCVVQCCLSCQDWASSCR